MFEELNTSPKHLLMAEKNIEALFNWNEALLGEIMPLILVG